MRAVVKVIFQGPSEIRVIQVRGVLHVHLYLRIRGRRNATPRLTIEGAPAEHAIIHHVITPMECPVPVAGEDVEVARVLRLLAIVIEVVILCPIPIRQCDLARILVRTKGLGRILKQSLNVIQESPMPMQEMVAAVSMTPRCMMKRVNLFPGTIEVKLVHRLGKAFELGLRHVSELKPLTNRAGRRR